MSILRSLLNLLIEQENKKPEKRQTGNPPSPRIRRINVKYKGKVRHYRVNQYGEMIKE